MPRSPPEPPTSPADRHSTSARMTGNRTHSRYQIRAFRSLGDFGQICEVSGRVGRLASVGGLEQDDDPTHAPASDNLRHRGGAAAPEVTIRAIQGSVLITNWLLAFKRCGRRCAQTAASAVERRWSQGPRRRFWCGGSRTRAQHPHPGNDLLFTRGESPRA